MAKRKVVESAVVSAGGVRAIHTVHAAPETLQHKVAREYPLGMGGVIVGKGDGKGMAHLHAGRHGKIAGHTGRGHLVIAPDDGKPPATVCVRPEEFETDATTGNGPDPEAAPEEEVVPPPTTPTPQRLPDRKLAQSLHVLAAKLMEEIEHKGRPANFGVNMTRKRSQELAQRQKEAERLREHHAALLGLADLWELGRLPDCIAMVRNRAQVADLLTYDSPPSWEPEAKRAVSMGLWDPAKWKEARDYLSALAHARDANRAARRAERELDELRARVRLQRPPGFFPTPRTLCTRMAIMANLERGMAVLEPTAGDGALAEVMRAMQPSIDLTVQESQPQLRRILELRNFTLAEGPCDFLAMHPSKFGYDRIVANFPFENHQSRAMLRHAYDLLRPGGRIVAIIAPNALTLTQGRMADLNFASWLSALEHEVEDLPNGTFAPDTQTGGILVTVDKPA